MSTPVLTFYYIGNSFYSYRRYTAPKNVALFERMRVLNATGCAARQEVMFTQYTGVVEVEVIRCCVCECCVCFSMCVVCLMLFFVCTDAVLARILSLVGFLYMCWILFYKPSMLILFSFIHLLSSQSSGQVSDRHAAAARDPLGAQY